MADAYLLISHQPVRGQERHGSIHRSTRVELHLLSEGADRDNRIYIIDAAVVRTCYADLREPSPFS